MLDFTSALYLGIRHPSWSLRPWSGLTAGVPAAFKPPAGAQAVEAAVARLQGCERALLASSTLHLFWDLFGVLARSPVTIFFDSGVYPVAKWGIERAAARGSPAHDFRHHDPAALRFLMGRRAQPNRTPVVVTDGVCPRCGRPAPLREYFKAAIERDGLVIVDDTQALGLLGASPDLVAPYGAGGGGSLRFHGLYGHDVSRGVVLVSSLAKAFGAPVAALSGGRAIVSRFGRLSETRAHSSPPSVAVIHAAEHALEVNRRHGDELRKRLAGLVRAFREGVFRAGLETEGGLFPVQTLRPHSAVDAVALDEMLARSGVRALLRRGRKGNGALLSFLITTGHLPEQIDRVVEVLGDAVRGTALSPLLRR
ncbi:MAG TPA: aminotransferase class I/II-fold pyridoxal phosphate-dependent enzyme [Blastocatellia bacterium]|nr:aminotransferase class I/II-fold pyridoxal phosphate-dependent enzyme [Blastocatellia bacterium]